MGLPPPTRSQTVKRKPKSRWPLIAGLGTTVAILVLGVVSVLIAQKRRPTDNVSPPDKVAKVSHEQKDSASSNTSEVAGKSQADAKKPTPAPGAEKKTEERKAAEEEATALEKLVKDYVDKADAASQQAHTFAKDASTAKDIAAGAINEPDPDTAVAKATIEASKAGEAAENAAAKEKEAKAAAAEMEIAVPSAKRELFPTVSTLANGVLNAATDAANWAGQARASGEKAKSFLARAVAAKHRAEEALAIADSLHRLNATVDFPKCRAANADNRVEIGELPENDYCLDLVGKKKVLPDGFKLEISQPEKQDNKVIWKCNLVQEKEEPISIAKFVFEARKLSVQWTEMAGTKPDHSNQLRNCLLLVWNKDVGPEKVATICLGEPESVSETVAFKVKFTPEGKTFQRSLDLTSLLADRTVALELLDDQKISNNTHVWPCLKASDTTTLSADGNTPHKQQWRLTVGRKEKPQIEFTLSGEKSNSHDQKVKFNVSLKCDGENRQVIESKSETIDELEKRRREIEEQKKKEKGADPKKDTQPLEIKINELDGQIKQLKIDRHDLEDELNQLRSTLSSRSLRYRIVLLLGNNKKRVVYTTEQ